MTAPSSTPAGAGEIASAFPQDLVLAPVSRRPTRLEEPTLRALLDRPVPDFSAPAPEAPDASVVVPTRNNLPFLRLCLESVLAAGDPCEVIVVDNASSDGTAEYLERLGKLNPNVRVVRNSSNRAFATSCNQGARIGHGDVLVLLNDDTAVTPGWLGRLVAQFDAPRVGMVGPTTNRTGNEAQIDADYTTWGELVRFAEKRAAAHAREAFEIRTLTMFCVAMRMALYQEVGPLDERFETGLLEDDDYSRRVRAAGYRLVCADDAFVHHFGETSFGKLVATGDYRRLLEANKARYEEKWHEPWQPYERRQSDRYRDMAELLRARVAEVVPEGAIVLVVSRGDEELVRLEDREGRHFPRAANGAYAGHHPADSAEAIAALEAEREAGAGHIVFPSTGLWWLRHYDGLRRHLDARYERQMSDPDACVIFDLSRSAT